MGVRQPRRFLNLLFSLFSALLTNISYSTEIRYFLECIALCARSCSHWLHVPKNGMIYKNRNKIVNSTLFSDVLFWFNQEEIRSLSKHVSRFEAENLEDDQIRKHFRIPNPGESYEVYSVADILGVINLELKTPLSATKVGMLLNKMGFRSLRTNKLRGYKVCRYSVEEISNNRKEKVNDAEEQNLPF